MTRRRKINSGRRKAKAFGTWSVVTGRGRVDGYGRETARLGAKGLAAQGLRAAAVDADGSEAFVFWPDQTRPFGWDEKGGETTAEGGPLPPSWWEAEIGLARTPEEIDR